MVSELKVFSQSESNHIRCGPSDETFLIQRHKKYPLRSRRNAKINSKTLSTPARRCMAGITRIDTKNFCRADRWSDRMCFSHKGTKKIHPPSSRRIAKMLSTNHTNKINVRPTVYPLEESLTGSLAGWSARICFSHIGTKKIHPAKKIPWQGVMAFFLFFPLYALLCVFV
jgi:hypothetical protein